MEGRDRPAFHHPGQSLTLVVIQLRGLSWRIAVDQASQTLPVESQNPVPNGLEPDAPNPRRLSSRAAVIDLCKGQKATSLRRVLRRLTPQTSGIEISSQRNRDAQGGPPRPPTSIQKSANSHTLTSLAQSLLVLPRLDMTWKDSAG